MINARIETVTTKPAFKAAAATAPLPVAGAGLLRVAERRRPARCPTSCTIRTAGCSRWPASTRSGATRHAADDDPDRWLWTCTVITQQATDLLGQIHDRNPVIVPAELHAQWLDCSSDDPATARRLLDRDSRGPPRALCGFISGRKRPQQRPGTDRASRAWPTSLQSSNACSCKSRGPGFQGVVTAGDRADCATWHREIGHWRAPHAALPVHARVELPGSKSLTNRVLILAALADGPSRIGAAARTRHDADGRCAAHARRRASTTTAPIWVVTPGPLHGGAIDTGLAGTVMRFVPPVAALADGAVTFDGDDRTRASGRWRPCSTGCARPARSSRTTAAARMPFTVRGTGAVAAAPSHIDASASSQFVSGLLLAGARYDKGIEVVHTGEAACRRSRTSR